MKKERLVRLEGNELVLTLGKKVTRYLVEDICPDVELANPAFRLTKEDGTSYTVAKTKWGVSCDCGDAVWRRDKRNEICKHAAAAIAVGLIELDEIE